MFTNAKCDLRCRFQRIILAGCLLGTCIVTQAADELSTSTENPVDEELLQQMPIQEVTVFKDGHAFVLHAGEMEVSDEGIVHLSHLPAPVMGTFWPYAVGHDVKLQSVVAEKRNVRSTRTALDIPDLIRANVGAKAAIKQSSGQFTGTIVGVPTRVHQNETVADPGDPQQLMVREEAGSIVLIETSEGHRAIPLSSIQEVTFLERPREEVEYQKQQSLLSLRLQWPEGGPREQASVGLAYIQRGIRWIPSYRLELDGKGTAHVKLQATLINEMVDLQHVTANLVIGVPHFTFKDTVDPISLGQTVAQLSSYFQEGSQTTFMLSNSIQTQVARMGEHRAPVNRPAGESAADLGPDLPAGDKREDLFVFTVNDVTLKKGQRMVVPVVEFDVPYEDVYTLRLDMTPPPELMQHFNSGQQQQLAALLHAPKAAHQARLTNRSNYPLTTAPALIMQNGQPLGQAMMTYTSVGAQVDVEITSAVDISVSKSDVESNRVPNAANWGGNSYDKVELAGDIDLHNFGSQPVKLEVVRYVLGNVDEAGAGGTAKKLNVREEGWSMRGGYPAWWHWYEWPYGWYHLNGLGSITWNVELPPGQGVSLPYTWHYFWRR